MKTEICNPLIGITLTDTPDKVAGMIDLLHAVDYSGVGLTESAEIGHGTILDLIRHALRYESERSSRLHAIG